MLTALNDTVQFGDGSMAEIYGLGAVITSKVQGHKVLPDPGILYTISEVQYH